MATVTNNTNKTKRETVRQILNRKKVYMVADYVRAVSKATGRKVSKSEIRNCLSHMQSEQQIDFHYTGEYVCGFCIAA